MVKKQDKGLVASVAIPDGVTATLNEAMLTIKGGKGEVIRNVLSPLVAIEIKDKAIVLTTTSGKKKFSRMFQTLCAHVANMIKGSMEPFLYEVKICSGHFPMTVKKDGDEVVISNFLGEKIPRRSKIVEGVALDIKGDLITITASDIEKAGQTAANLERATIIKKRDIRVFQDGCYITVKPNTK